MHPIFKDLQEFIKALEAAGELVRIAEPVSPELEIAEITCRVSHSHGPALLFENVSGGSMSVLTNAFGSLKRMCMALGISDLDSLASDVLDFIDLEDPAGYCGRHAIDMYGGKINPVRPVPLSSAPCQERVFVGDEVDLSMLPVLKCWPGDGGPSLTMPVVFTRDPETGVRNAGVYRMQVYGRNRTGMHWYASRGGARHYRSAERLNEPLEAAVCIGPDPVTTYAATAPLPDGIDELLFAGFIRHSPVELVKCRTVDMEVPAQSQIVLEGFLAPGERLPEGPFGNHTGCYSPVEEYPVFHVTCMTMKKSPVYQATVAGPPPQEDCFMAKATERLFLPLIKRTVPGVVDVNLPIEGIFGNLAFVSIDKRFPGHARKVMNALWGHFLGTWRIICVFDRDVDVQDMTQVLWRLGNNIDPKRDVCFTDGPVDILAWSAPFPGYGSRMGIDCTVTWDEEGGRPCPGTMEMDPAVRQRVDLLWSRLGL